MSLFKNCQCKGGSESKTVWSDLMRVKKLRQEMEKVRLLLELIRKRERTKRELVCIACILKRRLFCCKS